MHTISFDIQLLLCTMWEATLPYKAEREKMATCGEEIHGPGKMEMVSKIMYVGLGGCIPCVMCNDNYSHPFVATMTSDTTGRDCGLRPVQVRMRRSMIMVQKTPRPLPMQLTTVSHALCLMNGWAICMGKNRYRTLVRGYCGCYGEVKDRKQAADGLFVLTTNVLKH